MAFRLTSTAFKHDGVIPDRFTCYGANVSPELAWGDAPPKTQSFTLVVEDADAKNVASYHWLLWNLDSNKHALPEGIAKAPSLPEGAQQGKNDFGTFGYSGPCLRLSSTHHYVFTLYALDSILTIPAGSADHELMRAMQTHVLAKTQLVGIFKMDRKQSRMVALENDKEFVLDTDRVRKKLLAAYSEDPSVVSRFFQRHSLTSAFAEAKIREFLDKVTSKDVRRALEDYVKYANRFRVAFRLKTKPLEFTWVPWQSHGDKFHVKVVGYHLEPAGRSAFHNDPFVESFRSDNLKILDEAQELIDSGEARFVQIEDSSEYSLLKDIESFSYKDDGVAFFLHNAEQPYLGCIFGEKMSKKLLADIGKTVTEFQKKHFFRPPGGRPPKMENLKKIMKIDQEPMSAKAKAAELAKGGDEKQVKTKEVELSRLRSAQRKRAKR